MYKMSELRAKDREELLKLISELKGKLLALRFENATGQLSETHLPAATKKDIAKIFTVLKEKELGIVIETKEPTFTKVESTDSTAEVIIERVEEDETPATETAQVEEVKETTPEVESTPVEETKEEEAK